MWIPKQNRTFVGLDKTFFSRTLNQLTPQQHVFPEKTVIVAQGSYNLFFNRHNET